MKKSQQEGRQEDKLFNHVDLVHMLDVVDLENGTAVAGGFQETAERGPRCAAWQHQSCLLVLCSPAGQIISPAHWLS